MATRATVRAGTWSDPATWSGGIIPGDGDSVTIDHAVTLDGAFTIGTGAAGVDAVLVNAGGELTIADGASLTLLGDVRQELGTTVTGLGGGRIVFASASPILWRISDTNPVSGGPGAARFLVRGTATSRFRIESAVGAARGRFGHSSSVGGWFDAEYCTLVRVGDAANRAIGTALNQPLTLRLDHCEGSHVDHAARGD